MDTRDAKLLKQTEVLGGYDPKQYQSERIYATAKDGTKIPISIVYKKGLVKDGQGAAVPGGLRFLRLSELGDLLVERL